MLTLENIACRRQGRTLFKGLGLTVGDGCLVLIKGNNGSGKTSLLKIMAQLLEPDEGRVVYANAPITSQHFAEYCDIIHYIGHHHGLKLALTVAENLAFWASLKGHTYEFLPPALHFFKLEEVANMPVVALSMGWKKRVALAKLLTRKADIWLLDEPYTFLDKEGRFLLTGLIQARLDQGGSVILTTNEDLSFEDAKILNLNDFI